MKLNVSTVYNKVCEYKPQLAVIRSHIESNQTDHQIDLITQPTQTFAQLTALNTQ